MIWLWINSAWVWLLKLVIPPPAKPVTRKLDANAPCPACGNTSGTMRAVQLESKRSMVQHVCNICHAKWYEKPIIEHFGIVHADSVRASTMANIAKDRKSA